MRLLILSALLVISTCAPAQEHVASPAPVVFLDIAGPDVAALKSFYADLFGWNIGGGGQQSIPAISPMPFSFRQDPTDKRFYIGVADVARKLDEIKARGGTIEAPRFAVHGVAILGLFKDPAGNTMGLVEMENGKAKIP